jgi:hypothetical protein
MTAAGLHSLRQNRFSQGDIIRLTKNMIDRKNRVIVPEDGRGQDGCQADGAADGRSAGGP